MLKRIITKVVALWVVLRAKHFILVPYRRIDDHSIETGSSIWYRVSDGETECVSAYLSNPDKYDHPDHSPDDDSLEGCVFEIPFSAN